MLVVELQELEEVKNLIAKGQRVGVLSYAEIATATAGLDVDETDIEELHGFLERAKIELVEDIDPATAVANEVERAPDKRGRRKAKRKELRQLYGGRKPKSYPLAHNHIMHTDITSHGETAYHN